MNYYKDRTVIPGQLVEVYRNLHHGGYSIRDAKTKAVLAHADSVKLEGGITFRVSEKGRLKTVNERRKRVHAWVTGYFVSGDEPRDTDMNEVIFYDPYKTPLFEWEGKAVTQLQGEIFFEGKVAYTTREAALLATEFAI